METIFALVLADTLLETDDFAQVEAFILAQQG